MPGDGTLTNVHITDYGIEGEIPLKELCPFTRLRVRPGQGGLAQRALRRRAPAGRAAAAAACALPPAHRATGV